MEETTATTETQPFLGEDWFDPLETAVRGRIRGFIEEMLEAELHAALQRGALRPARNHAWSPPWPLRTSAGRHLRPGHTIGPARAVWPGRWPQVGVAQPDDPGLQAAHQAGRGADRRGLSLRHPHPAGATGARCAVRWGHWQGHGEPGLAQGADGLGGVAEARFVEGRHRSSRPRRHGRSGSPG